jgi:hypothetical protein
LLVREYRDGGYADRLDTLRFCVLDPLTNAVYAWANLALAEIAGWARIRHHIGPGPRG